MKIFAPVILAALLPISLPARAETPIINLSVGGQVSPGVYGQVQFGNAPPRPRFFTPNPRSSCSLRQEGCSNRFT